VSIFTYIAYGLEVYSSKPIPGLLRGRAKERIEILFGRVDWPESAEKLKGVYITPQEAYLYWAAQGTFLVRGGREIILDPAPGVAEEILHLILLGPCLAILLHQRGLMVLHASGIVRNGGAILFLAESGLGKSTLAAAMYAKGYRLVADDVVPIDGQGPIPLVFPGFPQLRVHPEAILKLGGNPKTLSRVLPKEGKCLLRAERGFSQYPLPLKRIYVLAEGLNAAAEEICLQEALIELVRHTYRIRDMHAVKGLTNFLQCGSLANHVRIRRLRSPRGLGGLPELIRVLEQDLETDR
jgi:hypothetical protein